MEKWTEVDNIVAEAELRMSEYLTGELEHRPVRLRVMMTSRVVQKNMAAMHDALDEQLEQFGKKVRAIETRTYGPRVKGRVFVNISLDDEADDEGDEHDEN